MAAESTTTAVRSLPDAVRAALGAQSDEIPALEAAVRAAADDSAVLTKWLASLDPELVAKQSYWHRNGFAKLVLHVDENFRIRMHVWPVGENRLGEFNPHGHRWNFASTVLCGDGLGTEEYEESPNGQPFIRHEYLGGGVSGLVRVGAVRLESVSRKVVRSGERHSVDIAVLHTVTPVGTDMVATLVVQGRLLTQNTAVYCTPDEVIDETPNAITPAEVRDLVNAVCGTLKVNA